MTRLQMEFPCVSSRFPSAMSFDQSYKPAEQTGKNDGFFDGPRLSQRPTLQHSSHFPSTGPHYDFARAQPPWPVTPTSLTPAILPSPRQRNPVIQSGESPRQPYQTSSTVVSLQWETSQIDDFHTGTFRGTNPYLFPGSKSQ